MQDRGELGRTNRINFHFVQYVSQFISSIAQIFPYLLALLTQIMSAH